MNRRQFCKSVALGAAALSLPRWLAEAQEMRRPNIVYVFADQHRQCSWSGGGDPQVHTPNLEVLGREGAVFNHCISNYPLCSPHRASLITGRYAQANTITSNVGGRGGLPATEVSIADVLKKAGYATGYVGKWHLYPGAHGGSRVPAGPDRHGFDWWRVCHNYRKRYDTKYYDDAGKEIVIPDYAPKGQMDLAFEFIEKNKDRPFCIFVSWHPPHPPYAEAPKRFAEMYSPEKIKLRPNVPSESGGQRERERHVQYFAHISALDEEIGRLMKKLADLGLADNTIVCYSSDHGDMLGSFGLGAKRKPWEEAVNVPFVIRWPTGIPARRAPLDTLFSTVDVTPTLLGLAGLPPPPAIQGADISNILTERGTHVLRRASPFPSPAGPDSAFIMSISHDGDEEEDEADAEKDGRKRKKEKKGKKNGKMADWRGVRTHRYTFVKRNTGEGMEPWLLYDNEKDPYQQRNLISDPAHAATRKELDGLLANWRNRAGERDA